MPKVALGLWRGYHGADRPQEITNSLTRHGGLLRPRSTADPALAGHFKLGYIADSGNSARTPGDQGF